MREERHPSLSRLTTLGIGGYAKAIFYPETVEDLQTVQERIAEAGRPYVLGRGSNTLAQDGELDLVVVKPAFAETIAASSEDDGVRVRVSASCMLPKLLAYTASHGYAGLEALAGIPGTLGGAIAMNAGSFGTEIGSLVSEVTVWQNGTLLRIPRSDLSFGYRSFRFPHQDAFFVITEALLTLGRGKAEELVSAQKAHLATKRNRQPITEKSAGCVFKNPEGCFAGKLLEEAGLKGARLGGMAFSTLHANFMINTGQGTAQEAFALIEKAKDAVYAKHGLVLTPEVRIVPCLP
ncbi:MAG: UDP-N-acetylmuramate dehydrogenase [Desulfovibrio sp.]|nr:UDP-N-acetylmuramate dehydrogenase [Desulfovibrio sp.]